jgi:hypothetical protein
MTAESVCRSLRSGELPAAKVEEYLDSLHVTQMITVPDLGKDLRAKTFVISDFLKSLHGFSLAVKTYRDLPGCTISLQLISSPLHGTYWVPELGARLLTRQQKFACISMLESGSYNGLKTSTMC